MREIAVTESPGCDHPEWTVEEDNEGGAESDMAIFVGPNAEQRAKAYAEWLRDSFD
jgi:hypothetical protein